MRCCGLLVALFWASIVWSQDEYDAVPYQKIDSTQPYLKVLNVDAKIDQVPLLMTAVDVNISGLMAQVKVTQYYKNDGDVPLETQYVFPGSADAAVYRVSMQVGDRLIEAEIQEKKQARATYEQAKKAGKTTSLLTQGDPGLFTMNLANVLPGDDIRVELEYVEKIIPKNGRYQFRYPAVGRPSVLRSGSTAPTAYKPGADMGFDLVLKLHSALPINDIKSKNHDIQTEFSSERDVMAFLSPDEALNFEEDFIIEYDLRDAQINTGLSLYEDDDAGYFLLMMEPPSAFKPTEIIPREYIFLVDSSGSMDGAPIENAQFIANALMDELTDEEYFNVLLFAGGSTVFHPESMQATSTNTSKAMEMVAVSNAGGGTNLLGALESVNAIPQIAGVSRTLVVLTDGAISVPDETIELLRNTPNQNVFVIGVSVGGWRNDDVAIRAIAAAGQGQPFFIQDDADVDRIRNEFLDYVRYPLLTDVSVEALGFEGLDLQPNRLNDLFAQRPLYLTGRYAGKQRGSIRISGRGNGKQYSEYFDLDGVAQRAKNEPIKYLWAKEKINHLMSDREKNAGSITELGLNHSLLTEFTSFVAVDQVVRNDRPGVKHSMKPKSSGFQSASLDSVVSRVSVVSGYGHAEDVLKVVSSGWSQNDQIPDLTFDMPTEKVAIQTGDRRNITFILGQDRTADNQYYQLANRVFTNNDAYKTALVINEVNTLDGVKQYLQEHHQEQAPWGLVNIVTHSSPWSGIQGRDDEHAPSALNVMHLMSQSTAQDITGLSDAVVDAGTVLRIYGCSLGEQAHLLNAIARYFGGNDLNRPQVQAAAGYVHFSWDAASNEVLTHEIENPWHISRTGHPDPDLLTQFEAGMWQAKPIELVLKIDGLRSLPASQIKAVLSKQTALKLMLDDLQASTEDFKWRVEMDGSGQWVLSGRAHMISIQPKYFDALRWSNLNWDLPERAQHSLSSHEVQ